MGFWCRLLFDPVVTYPKNQILDTVIGKLSMNTFSMYVKYNFFCLENCILVSR